MKTPRKLARLPPPAVVPPARKVTLAGKVLGLNPTPLSATALKRAVTRGTFLA